MQVTAVMGLQHILGQEVAGELLGDDARHQITHHGENIGILVGILRHGLFIGLVHQAHELGMQNRAAYTDAVAVVPSRLRTCSMDISTEIRL